MGFFIKTPEEKLARVEMNIKIVKQKKAESPEEEKRKTLHLAQLEAERNELIMKIRENKKEPKAA